MTNRETWRSQPVLDPLGAQAAQPAELAARPSTLAGRTVVLFDNGKLDPAFGNFLALFDIVAQALRERDADLTLARVTVDLLASGGDPVAQARNFIDANDPAAVVIAFADSGVTQRTVELARQLETAGIPTCVLAVEPGHGLAGAIARANIPGLPIVEIPVLRTDSLSAVAQVAGQHVDAVIDGITRPIAEQWVRFDRQFPAGREVWPADADGHLELPTIRRSPGTALDPNHWTEILYDRLTEVGLGDGLPVVAPTPSRVEALLATVSRPADHVLVPVLIPSGAPVTVEKLAINAVLAGCRPDVFPIVLAAFEAMTEPRYRLLQSAITSHPSGNLLLVSGPLAEQVGISGGAGCLGPGHRANATIGRALTLTLINVGRIRPGEADLAGFGSPAEFAYCFAENRAASPWPTFVEERYPAGTTCVLVHRCEAPHNVIDHLSVSPEGVLGGIASVAATIGGNNAYQPAELIVLLNPEHAHLIADAGWTKRDVQLFLWDEARNLGALLAGRGLPPNRRRSATAGEWVPVVNDPDEIIVVVAGGPGPQSMVAIPWGFARAVHRPVETAKR